MTLLSSKSRHWSSLVHLGVFLSSSLSLMSLSCSEIPMNPVRNTETAKTAVRYPVMQQPSPVTVNEGGVVYFQLKVTNPNNEDLEYFLVNEPDGMQVTRNGDIYWQTEKGDAGTYKVKASVNMTNQVVFTVTVKKVNKPPVIKKPASVKVKEGGVVSFQLKVTDPDGDELLYSLSNAPRGMQVTRNGGIYWQTQKKDAGTYKVKVKADDQRGGTDTETFTVTVSKK